MKHYSNLIYLLVLTVLMAFMTGCQEDVAVKFLVNGNEQKHSLDAPDSDDDYYEVFIDDSEFPVIVVDKSTPGDAVHERVWTLRDKDRFEVRKVTDSAVVYLSFPNTGIYSITLETNGIDDTKKRHWLNVKGTGVIAPISSDTEEIERAPVEFIVPYTESEESLLEDYTIEIHTEAFDFSELENLEIKVGKKKLKEGDYTFSEEDGTISADIKLKNGKNPISYSVTFDGEEYAAESVVEYEEVTIADKYKEKKQDSGGLIADNNTKKNSSNEEKKDKKKEAPVVNGCTDAAACNYNVKANKNDGSCILPGSKCNDNNPATTNDVIKADCKCEGTVVEKKSTYSYEDKSVEAAFKSLSDYSCGEADGSTYKFTVKADRETYLDYIYFFTDISGKVEVKIVELSTVIAKETQTISGGLAQISLEFANEPLQAGKTWEIRIETISGSGSQKPQLMNLAGCSLNSPATPFLKPNWKGKNYIAKLDYTY